MIFLDSNIVLDLMTHDSHWQEWSIRTVGRMAPSPLVCSHVVLAEVASRFSTLEEELGHLSALRLEILTLSEEAAFRAGKAHAAYRAAGGARDAILADFLIGAHAGSIGATLMTRDRRRFGIYFPDLALITPETHPHG